MNKPITSSDHYDCEDCYDGVGPTKFCQTCGRELKYEWKAGGPNGGGIVLKERYKKRNQYCGFASDEAFNVFVKRFLK